MLYLFEDYALDTDRRELTKADRPIAVQPQVFDVLAFLAANRERVVTKDELIEAVWDGRVVSESTLTSRINAARNAVGDSGEAQRLIKTASRKGFRFIGMVRETAVAKTRASSPPAGTLASATTPATENKPPRLSIVVLPFVNLGSDPEQDYFVDGVTESLTTDLSRIRGSFVIGRNTAFTYKDTCGQTASTSRSLNSSRCRTKLSPGSPTGSGRRSPAPRQCAPSGCRVRIRWTPIFRVWLGSTKGSFATT